MLKMRGQVGRPKEKAGGSGDEDGVGGVFVGGGESDVNDGGAGGATAMGEGERVGGRRCLCCFRMPRSRGANA